MDRCIEGFLTHQRIILDDDLVLCPAMGVAWQHDMTVTAAYDENYFDKCAGYEDKDIAVAINEGRIAMVDRHAGAPCDVLDIGVGSGEFVRKRPHTFGFDINPAATTWLKARGRWREDFEAFRAFTFWDVIEHVPEPETYFRRVPPGSVLFASIPVFVDLHRIRESRHYRPGEHLYYFTESGFTDWMALHGFEFLERADFETAAGRELILSFAFRRSRA
jgi:hypothetical protein